MRKISVIIPTYNRAATIAAAAKSVLDQTYEHLELIIVDDASTDDTGKVVKSLADPRVRYDRTDDNRGAAAARNRGVRLADTDIIAFHDSDDIWHPDKLEKQMAYWEQHQDYSMIYSKFCVHRGNRVTECPWQEMDGVLEGDLFRDLLRRNSIGAPTIVADRDCFLQCGGFDETLRAFEDWEFVVRFSKDYLIGYVDEVLVDAYLWDSGVSHDAQAVLRTRFRMLSDYGGYLMRENLLEELLEDIIRRANEAGQSDYAAKLLQEYFM